MTVERYRITGQDARGQVTGLVKGGIEVSRTYAGDTGRLDTLYARNAGYVTLNDFAFTFDVLGNLAGNNDEFLDRPRVARFEPDRTRDLSVSGSQVP